MALRAAVDLAVSAIAFAADADDLPLQAFDDIVYFGADAERIEQLQGLLATRGVIDIVLGGDRIGRPIAVDVGRIHYDLTRWVGTAGSAAAAGYATAPGDGELRAGDRVAVIGAAGPIGFMHSIRTALSPLPGLSLTAIDIDDARLARLADIAGPLAASRGLPAVFLNSRTTRPEPGFTYVAVMVPAPPLVAEAVDLAGDHALVNIFAGFAAGTRAALDLDAILAKGIYLFGTSGSGIPDMLAVLAKLERGDLDTNISVDAVCGMEGVGEALAAVEARTTGGKIVVYPALHELGLIRLAELADRLPSVAAALHDGRWTRAAEEALLAAGGGRRQAVKALRLHGVGDLRLADEPAPVPGPGESAGPGDGRGHLRLRPALVRRVSDRRGRPHAPARSWPRGGRRDRRRASGRASGWRSIRRCRAAPARRARPAVATSARRCGSSATPRRTGRCAS